MVAQARYFEELLTHEREELLREPPATFASGAWMHFAADPSDADASPDYWCVCSHHASAELEARSVCVVRRCVDACAQRFAELSF